MNLNAAMPLIAAVACGSLAVVLLIPSRGSRVNHSLAVFCACCTLWNLSQFMVAEDWLVGCRPFFEAGLQAGFVLTPAALIHFCFEAVRDPKPKLIPWLYGVYASLALAGAYGAYLKTIVFAGHVYVVSREPAAPGPQTKTAPDGRAYGRG